MTEPIGDAVSELLKQQDESNGTGPVGPAKRWTEPANADDGSPTKPAEWKD